MKLITSRQNAHFKARCKLQQKKQRQLSGLFLVEGIRMVEEALQSGTLVEIFFSDVLFKTSRGQRLFQLIEKSSIQGYQLDTRLLRLLAATESPQGIVGVVRQESLLLKELKINSGLIVVLDGLQDPGNLGTIWRTAWAVGVDALFCLPGTVDPYNSKVIRASMGAVFQVPLLYIEWPELHDWLRKTNFQLIAADVKACQNYTQFGYAKKVAVLIGNEGQGFLSIPLNEVDEQVKIPLQSGVESLNAAVASGVLLYEILRQRN